jgi:hypothetical protein
MRLPKNSTDYVVEDRGYVTPCWIWQRAKSEKGYGNSYVNGKKVRAHRVYYEFKYGKIPEGMVPDHLCRVPACVNPDHIEIVTNAVNCQRGDMADITPETVLAIRQCHDLTFSEMANRFNVSISNAKNVYYGYTWRNVEFTPPPPRKRRPFSRRTSPFEPYLENSVS